MDLVTFHGYHGESSPSNHQFGRTFFFLVHFFHPHLTNSRKLPSCVTFGILRISKPNHLYWSPFRCVIPTFNHLRSKPSWQHFWNAWVRKPSKGFVPKSLVGEDQRREDGQLQESGDFRPSNNLGWVRRKKNFVNHGRFQLPFPQLVSLPDF